jgi:hypothetical protein
VVTKSGSTSRVFMIALGLAMTLVPTVSALGQDAATGSSNIAIVQDWTHHHVVFSYPGTATDAIRADQYERWLKIVNDPRYIMQQQRRSLYGSEQSATESSTADPALQFKAEADAGKSSQTAARALQMTLEQREAAQRGNRRLPSGLSRALIPPSEMPLESSLISNGAPSSANINRMQKDWSEDMGSGGTVGLGDFPATFSTGGTSCTDFAIFNTGLAGTSGQASIVAYNNLYSSCNGGTPTAYWAFNTSGAIINSVDLSLDGSQIAVVQSNASGVATLVLIKWASGGTLTAPVTPTTVTNANYRTCTAPCMTSITLSGSPTDTYSFPYYDYGSDTVYVGDDVGNLHQFTNIFLSGTPAEVTNSPWPVTVFPTLSGESALGSPVYDSTSGNIFVGDYILNSSSNCEPSANVTNGTCGYLYAVNSTSGTVVRSKELDYNIGLLDSPIVDSSAGMVYVSVGDDGTFNCASSTPCAAVFQFPVNFASGAGGTEATVGPGYEFMMSGSFDNAYFTTNAGHLYVIGNTGPANNTLYQISITNNIMNPTTVVGPTLSTNYTNSYYSAGLQITEFFNSPHDYIFLSVLAYGNPTGFCGPASLGNGCIMGFDVTSGTISGSSVPTGATAEAGGTSGIVVDNAAVGGSNIYFSTLLNQTCTTSGGAGGCAIQTSQSAP